MAEPRAGLPGDASARIAEAVEREVAAICARYRADPAQARAALYGAISRQPGLVAAIEAGHALEDVTRLRAYKDAVKAARKAVYYQLRQYRRADESEIAALAARLADLVARGAAHDDIDVARRALLAAHASTRERDQEAFFQALFSLVDSPASILDLGCGLQPLAFPFEKHTTRYVAVDRDAPAIHTLEAFAPHVLPARLIPLQRDLASLDWAGLIAFGVERYDLALMLKLVPVVRRQQRDLLPVLAGAPVRRIVITGNVEALARREDIRWREDQALRAFIAMTGRVVVGQIDTPGEFGYVLE